MYCGLSACPLSHTAIFAVFRLFKPSNLNLEIVVSSWALFKVKTLLDQSPMKDDDTRTKSFCCNLMRGVSPKNAKKFCNSLKEYTINFIKIIWRK